VKYKLVIFDFDGTLADTFPWILGILDEVADKFKVKRIERSELETFRTYEVGKLLKLHNISLWKAAWIARYIRSLMAKDIDQIRLFSGMEFVLNDLVEKGATLALVSSNSFNNVCRVLGLQNMALIKYFECGVSLLGKESKFNKILRKSGACPEETLCIGDEIRDCQAARKSNLAFGAVSWGFTNFQALVAESPQEIFTRVDEIVEKIA
jgi:phosphoglycolate phosphatase